MRPTYFDMAPRNEPSSLDRLPVPKKNRQASHLYFSKLRSPSCQSQLVQQPKRSRASHELFTSA